MSVNDGDGRAPARTDQSYADSFAVIKRMCDERVVVPEWIDREITPDLSLDRPLRLLSVGAGPGDFDAAIMGNLFARGVPAVSYVAIEPSVVFVDALRGRFDGDVQIEMHLRREPFETADLTSLAGTQDLVVFMHSIYYMQNFEGAIRKALSLLTPKTGVLVLVLQASQGVSLIQTQFVRRLKLARNPGLNAERLLDVFDGIAASADVGVRYAVIPTTIETTGVLDGRGPDEHALFQFLLDTDPRAQTADVMAEFRSFVRDMSYQRGDRWFMLQPLGAFVAHRG